MMLAEWQVGEVFWAMLWFTLFFIWIWLLITVFADIFRSHDLGGFAKTLWVLFVIVVPYLGVFVYLIARGHKMPNRQHAPRTRQRAPTSRTPQARPRARRTSSPVSPTSRTAVSSTMPSSNASRQTSSHLPARRRPVVQRPLESRSGSFEAAPLSS